MKQKSEDNLKHWQREKDLIPFMIRTYCHGHHKTRGDTVCPECRELTEYALFRLDKCPFKSNKTFCSVCSVHCYKPEMRDKIRAVMRYSGPRMLFSHPVFALSHVAAVIKNKRQKNDR